MNFFFTKEQIWLDKWDTFLQTSNRGLYNQLSDWVKSYQVYGFDYNFFIVTNNDTIIGGCGIVIAKFSIFKFFSVPSGPVIEVGYDFILDEIILALKKEAQKQNCCYFQISLPYCDKGLNFNDYNLQNVAINSCYFTGNEGFLYKYVIPLQGMRIVDLSGHHNYETVFKKYNSNNKRNLSKTKQLDLQFKFVTSNIEINQAYNCFELNAKEKGYPLRSFDSIFATLRNYIDKDFAKIACCVINNKIVAALYVLKCGNRLIYINGGVLKEYQQFNISNYLHDKMIQYSISQGYKSYDLSVGGSKGVIQFKESFGSDLYLFIPSRHWILRPFLFKLFLYFEKHIKPYKSQIAKMLVFIKKLKFKKIVF